MAGKKNPWGGSGSGNGSGSGGDEDGSGADSPESGSSDGPRNPWLPGGGDDKQRSARIEDIFKNRGPDQPRGLCCGQGAGRTP